MGNGYSAPQAPPQFQPMPVPPMAMGVNAPNQPNYAMVPGSGDSRWPNRFSYKFYFCCTCEYKQTAPRTLRSFFCAQLALDIIFFLLSIRGVVSDVPSEGSDTWWGWMAYLLNFASLFGLLASIIFVIMARGPVERFMI